MNLINRDDIHITVHYARRSEKREVTDALVKAIEEAIFKLPVIDAEPVRHGTWKEEKVKIDGQFSLSIPCYLCSECGGYMDASPLLFKYCPYCGAKMDAQEKDDDRKID